MSTRLVLTAFAAALCAGASCQLPNEVPKAALHASGMSPPVIVTDEHPWKRGQAIAKAVPNSDVYVGHGDSMMPLYSSGTVIVVQRVLLAHLREGMTVIFCNSSSDPFSMIANVLQTHLEDGTWVIEGIAADSSRYQVILTDENYVGTVVAAIRSPDESKPFAERELVMNTASLSCALQCHIDGEVHPKIIPFIPTRPPTGIAAPVGVEPGSP